MLQAGDSVFYCDNRKDRSYSKVAWAVIQSLGLRPVVYQGIKLDVQHSSLDREVRADFYAAAAAVIVIGSGREWDDSELWIDPDLPHFRAAGMTVLVYILPGAIKYEGTNVSSPDEFKKALRKDLHSLVA